MFVNKSLVSRVSFLPPKTAILFLSQKSSCWPLNNEKLYAELAATLHQMCHFYGEANQGMWINNCTIKLFILGAFANSFQMRLWCIHMPDFTLLVTHHPETESCVWISALLFRVFLTSVTIQHLHFTTCHTRTWSGFGFTPTSKVCTVGRIGIFVVTCCSYQV
jgi:hypothetical protein